MQTCKAITKKKAKDYVYVNIGGANSKSFHLMFIFKIFLLYLFFCLLEKR